MVSAQMTLNDCLRYARDHAHANVLNRIAVEKAEVNKRIAASDLMPYIGISTSGNVSFGRNIDPETNTYDNKQTLSTGFGLSMSIPLFDGLVSVNNLKAARVAQLRQIQSAQAEADMISMDVIRAFYNVSYCRAMTEQMQSQLERDSTDLAATQRGEQLGSKSGADVAELRALVATDEYELANQKGLLAKAYLALRSAMGMAPSTDAMEIDEAGTVETEGEPAVEHPRIAAARLELKESEYGLRAAKGAFSPRISLSAGISTSYYKMMGSGNGEVPSFRSQWKDNMGEYVGFSVTIPLFTGLATVNRLKRARIEVRESRTRLSQTEDEIAQAMAEAAIDVQTAEAEMVAAERRLEAEQTANEAMRRKYELGGASAIDLYTSGAKLVTARANYEGKRIQRRVSAILLAYYRGEKLIKE